MTTEGYVYFLHDPSAGLVKIGHSLVPDARHRNLERTNGTGLKPLALVPGGREEERAEHKKWRGLRRRGEWFADHPDLLAYAADLGICEVHDPLGMPSVREAERWMRYLLKREMECSASKEATARAAVAGRCHAKSWVLWNILKLRVTSVDAEVYFSLRDEFITEKQRELASLQAEVDVLTRERDGYDATAEVLADIQAVRVALGLDGGEVP